MVETALAIAAVPGGGKYAVGKERLTWLRRGLHGKN